MTHADEASIEPPTQPLTKPLTQPLGDRTVHLCIDMQNLFAEHGPWPTPWMERVLPMVEKLVSAKPRQTVFTRFMPPYRAEDATGQWAHFYQRWRAITREHVDPDLLGLLPSLRRFVPPAAVVDKPAYSPFYHSDLQALLQSRDADTLLVSGAETDVCVLAGVLDAVDRGYRVILARDALCSANDELHDGLLRLYAQRFSYQIEVADADDILSCWF